MIDWDAVVIGPLMTVFAEPVTYLPLAGGSVSVTGVFDDAYLKEVMFEDASTGTTEVSATLGVQLSQFQSPPIQNDKLTLVRTGATYIVRQVRLDSRGGARLLLTKASYP
ncbi:MAG TPA: hypothetical protein VF534_02025 [Paraburkholderia sp.]